MKRHFNMSSLALALWPKTRFIDINGRPWHKPSVIDKIDPSYVFGAAMAIGNVLLFPDKPGFEFANVVREVLLNTTMFGFAVLNIAQLEYNREHHERHQKKLSTLAIDTEGRSFPPPNTMALLGRVSQRQTNNKWCLGLIGFSGTFTFGAMAAIGDGSLAQQTEWLVLALGPALYKFGADYARCKKLLLGDYVFCGTPPAEPKKAPSPIAGRLKPLRVSIR